MHERFTVLMSMKLDEVATPEEQVELARHLSACPTCSAVWEQWQSIDRWLAVTPVVAPSRDLVADVSRGLCRQASKGSVWAWVPLGLLVLGVFSLGASCLAIAGLLWWGWRHPIEVGVALSSGAELLSSVNWALTRVETVIRGLGGSGLAAQVATGALGSVGLVALWVWVVSLGSPALNRFGRRNAGKA